MQGLAKNDFTLYKLKLEVAGMKKKLLSLVLTAALAVTGVVSSVGTVDKVQAESKEYMKKLEAHVRLFYKTFNRNGKE